MFNQSKGKQTVSRILNYNVVFRNPREPNQFKTLGYLMYTDLSPWLVNAFKCSLRRPHKYLILDHHSLMRIFRNWPTCCSTIVLHTFNSLGVIYWLSIRFFSSSGAAAIHQETSVLAKPSIEALEQQIEK